MFRMEPIEVQPFNGEPEFLCFDEIRLPTTVIFFSFFFFVIMRYLILVVIYARREEKENRAESYNFLKDISATMIN